MRYWDELLREQREGFEIIVDKTWEDLDPRGQFEDSDIDEILAKINNDTYDWFMLRVRVMLDGHELGSAYLGGCLYEDAREVLKDGVVEDMIYDAMKEARVEARRLVGSLAKVVDTAAV